MRRLIALGVLGFAFSAHAAPPPSYLALPSGYTVGRTEYHRYDLMEVSYPDPRSGGATSHIKPSGHWWRIDVSGDPRHFDFTVWRPALEGAGWTVLQAQGTFVLRRGEGTNAGDAWLKYTGGTRFDMVEIARPTEITLPSPGAVIEELHAGEDVPWLKSLPDMKQESFRIDEKALEETLSGSYMGPPVTYVSYTGSNEIVSLEGQRAYETALRMARWTILRSNESGVTTAHYTQNGRDIWLKVTPWPGRLTFAFSDVGAAAAAAKLRAALDKDGHVALYGIYFDTNKDVLRPDSEPTLQQILALLHDAPRLSVEIQGHTDSTGAKEHNQQLSLARAESVMRWLTEHGVAAARLTAKGYAETRPVADNKTPEGRARNRRVELADIHHK